MKPFPATGTKIHFSVIKFMNWALLFFISIIHWFIRDWITIRFLCPKPKKESEIFIFCSKPVDILSSPKNPVCWIRFWLWKKCRLSIFFHGYIRFFGIRFTQIFVPQILLYFYSIYTSFFIFATILKKWQDDRNWLLSFLCFFCQNCQYHLILHQAHILKGTQAKIFILSKKQEYIN